MIDLAGNMNSDSVIWNVGDTTGHAPGGASATIPGDDVSVGSGVPTGAPTGEPFYVNTANNKLYAWTGSAWVAISGANT